MVMCFRVKDGVFEEIILTSDDFYGQYGNSTVWEVMSATSAGLPYFDATRIDYTTFALKKGLTHIPSQSALKRTRRSYRESSIVLVSLGAGGGEPIPSHSLEPDWRLKGDKKSKDVFPVFVGWGIHHSYRLNVEGDLGQIPFDDWQPRKSGEATIQHIRDITETFLDTAEVEFDIHRIAKEAVRIRRARAQTELWEAFAINVEYTCSLCPGETSYVVSDRTVLREHLEASHKGRSMSNQEVERLLNASRTYRGRG